MAASPAMACLPFGREVAWLSKQCCDESVAASCDLSAVHSRPRPIQSWDDASDGGDTHFVPDCERGRRETNQRGPETESEGRRVPFLCFRNFALRGSVETNSERNFFLKRIAQMIFFVPLDKMKWPV